MWSLTIQWLLWLASRPLAIVFWTVSQVLRLFHGHPPIPPVSNRLLLYSASDLARLIRSGKVKCRDVVEAYVERVKEVNPVLNAVVQSRFDQALQDAEVVDMNLANSTRTEEEVAKDTPLLGVPVTVKESIPVSGMSNSAGVPGWNRVAQKDAEAIASLRASGAIPILVSNTPQLCLCWETYNPVTGRTNNPYDPRRTPGGSSGGEAALLGSAASVIGLGSDIGGSGRLPASFCGVFGHKPSSGYISVEGHMPASEDPMWENVFVFAPMARYAEDLPLMLKSCVGNKEKLKELRLDEPVDLKNIKFFYMDNDCSNITTKVHRDVNIALNRAINHIEQSFKVPVNKIEIADWKHTAQISFTLMLRMSACHNIFQKSEHSLTEWTSVTWQWIKWLLCFSPHALHALMYGTCKKAAELYSELTVKELEKCKDSIKEQIHAYLGDNGVLLYPTFPTTANLHMQVYYRMLNAGYLSFFNMLDMPATACPIMRNTKGIPVGIQIIAGRGQDRLTLAVAQEIEKAFGGWMPPTGAILTDVKT